MYTYYFSNFSNPIELKKKLLALGDRSVILDGDRIICKDQIITAIKRANHANSNNNAIAKTFGIEVMLQMVGSHQIDVALNILGVTEKTKLIIFMSSDKDVSDKINEEYHVGLPIFKPSEEVITYYNLLSKDKCKEVIAKGVLMVTDHE